MSPRPHGSLGGADVRGPLACRSQRPTFYSVDSERFDPKERAREKQTSRDQDARDLASGKKTREQPLRGKRARLGPERHQRAPFEAARVIDFSYLV